MLLGNARRNRFPSVLDRPLRHLSTLESTIYERPKEIIAHAMDFRAVRSISLALSGLTRHANGRSGELCQTPNVLNQLTGIRSPQLH
jgi:hypothetical protein